MAFSLSVNLLQWYTLLEKTIIWFPRYIVREQIVESSDAKEDYDEPAQLQGTAQKVLYNLYSSPRISVQHIESSHSQQNFI